MKRLLGSVFLSLAMLCPGLAGAADFPNRPITIVAGFNAGGTSDMILRAMAPELEKELGQPVLIVNKGGSGGALAIGDVLTKKADGYTLCLVNSPALTFDLQLRKARYDMNDFVYIGSAGGGQEGFYSLPDRPWKDFQSMIEYAKKENKELTFTSPSVFDTYVMKSIGKKEGLKFRKVPVKSGGEAATSVLGGHVDFAHGGGVQGTYVDAGKMIHLATTSTKPFVLYPDVKPLVSLGYPHTGFDNHYIIFVLKDPPKEAVDILAAAVEKVTTSKHIHDVILNNAHMDPTILKRDEILPKLQRDFAESKALIEAAK